MRNGHIYNKDHVQFSMTDTVQAGLIACTIAVTMTNPFDVIITRYQV